MGYGIHRKRYEGFNHARFLTCSCFKRRPFLNRDRSRQWLVEAIARAREQHRFELWAWVIMPEHFHVVIFPQPGGATLRPILSTIKQSVAKRALHWVRENRPEALDLFRDAQPNGRLMHRFWQRGGGYDRNLWTTEEIWEKIDYVHGNPVRRGLCASPADWLWSSAPAHLLGEGLLPLDRARLPSKQ